MGIDVLNLLINVEDRRSKKTEDQDYIKENETGGNQIRRLIADEPEINGAPVTPEIGILSQPATIRIVTGALILGGYILYRIVRSFRKRPVKPVKATGEELV